jgi:hypothetical protein
MEVATMSITFRSLNPGEEEQAVNTLRKGFGAATMRYFMWRFVDNPLWEYDYSVVGEYEGNIVAVSFLWPQEIKFLCKPVKIMNSGYGSVDPQFRRKGCYTITTKIAREKARNLGKTMVAGYVGENEFTYTTLKKIGFFHLFSQTNYVKILSVEKTATIAAEILNKTRIFRNLSLKIRLIPESEKSFVLRVYKGKFFVEEDSPDCDLELSGNLRKLVTLLIGNMILGIIPLVLKREVKAKFRVSSIKKVIQLALMLR